MTLRTPLILLLAALCLPACLRSGGSSSSDDKNRPDALADGEELPPQPCTVDAQCNDGLFCTGTRECINNFCEQVEAAPCQDDNPCTVAFCDEFYESCQFISTDANCAAGQMCDPELGCVDRPRCTEDSECDDGQPCTDDLCLDGACTYAPDNELCDSADFCGGDEICAPFLGCVSGGERSCDDADACTIDSCDPIAESCVHTPKDADEDGFIDAACGGEDCRDDDPEINPDGEDVCDGRDNDCDGVVDDEDPFGASDPANAEIFQPAAGNLIQADMAVTPAGSRVLAYLVDDGGSPRVYLKILDAEGAPVLDADVDVGIATAGPERYFAVAADGEEIVVVRSTAGTATETFDLLLDRFDAADGAAIGNTVLVADDQPELRYVDVASTDGDEPGSVYVAWNDARSGRPEVYVSEVKPEGIISSTPNALQFSEADTVASIRPVVARLADGTTAVAWVETGGVTLGQLALPEVSLQRLTVPGSASATQVALQALDDQFLVVYAEPATSGQGLRAATIAANLSNTPSETNLGDIGGSISGLNLTGTHDFLGAGFTADITGADRAYYLPIELSPLLAGDIVEVGDSNALGAALGFYEGVTFALISRPDTSDVASALELVRSDCPLVE